MTSSGQAPQGQQSQPAWLMLPSHPIERIAADVRTIKAWVTFFGILTCIGLGLWVLLILTTAASLA